MKIKFNLIYFTDFILNYETFIISTAYLFILYIDAMLGSLHLNIILTQWLAYRLFKQLLSKNSA